MHHGQPVPMPWGQDMRNAQSTSNENEKCMRYNGVDSASRVFVLLSVSQAVLLGIGIDL